MLYWFPINYIQPAPEGAAKVVIGTGFQEIEDTTQTLVRLTDAAGVTVTDPVCYELSSTTPITTQPF